MVNHPDEATETLARELAAIDGHKGEYAFFEYPLTDQSRDGYRDKARAIIASRTVRGLQEKAFDEAKAIIEDKHFAGPTKDMILGWLVNPHRAAGE